MKLTPFVDENLVCFLEASSKEDALRQIVDQLYRCDKIDNKEQFLSAVIEREKLVSTGIGMGVAIPHVKSSFINQFFISVVLLKKGVDWQALDDNPVKLLFLIGGPADKQTQYLQLLSSLTSLIKDQVTRRRFFEAKKPDQILSLF